MAKTCEFCGRGTRFGRQLSHAHNVSPRTFKPNIQTVRAVVDGTVRRIYTCTRCLRSGLVVKAPRRPTVAKAT
jgi:large subunit ribosomal protein L28